MSKLTIGADPEVFLRDNRGVISAHDIIPGSKTRPHKLSNCAVHPDGVALEFGIPPASSPSEFEKNLKGALSEINKFIPDNLRMVATPAVYLDHEYFESLPNSAKELGCDPDLNARTGKTNRTPKRPKLNVDRSVMCAGGGHLRDALDMGNAASNALRPLFEIINHNKDYDRKTLYGEGTPIRVKPYGVEIRGPSNNWLNYPGLWKHIYSVIDTVFHARLKGEKTRLSENIYYAGDHYNSSAKQKSIVLNEVYRHMHPSFKKEDFEIGALNG